MHAHDPEKGAEYLAAYRELATNFRAGVAKFLTQAENITKMSLDWSFSPEPPFKMAETQAAAA